MDRYHGSTPRCIIWDVSKSSFKTQNTTSKNNKHRDEVDVSSVPRSSIIRDINNLSSNYTTKHVCATRLCEKHIQNWLWWCVIRLHVCKICILVNKPSRFVVRKKVHSSFYFSLFLCPTILVNLFFFEILLASLQIFRFQIFKNHPNKIVILFS